MNMPRDRKIVIYCSANEGIDPAYNETARELARELCARDITIVFGGSVRGTMGEIADEVVKCKGHQVGVIPHFMEEFEYPGLTEVIWTETMADRKEWMRKGTCAAIALPGGIGTLDELIGTLTLAKLGKYSGKVFALNLGGFYNPLKALLDHYVATGMLDEPSRNLIMFPETVEELLSQLD